MAETKYPLINRRHVAWANIKITLVGYDGPPFQTGDISALDWDDSIEISKVRGTGPMHQGRAIGQYDSNASITMFLASALAFQAALLAGGKTALVDAPFDIEVHWEPLNGDGEVLSAKLVGAIISGRSSSNAPSADATALEMPLSIDSVELYDANGTVLRLV